MDCTEVRPWLATRRHLSSAQEAEIQAHLAGCSQCAAAWREEERTTRLLRSLPASSALPPEQVNAAILNRLLAGAPAHPGARRLVLSLGALGALLLILLLGRQYIDPFAASLPGGRQAASEVDVLLVAGQLLDTSGLPVAERLTVLNVRAGRSERFTSSLGDDAVFSPDGSRVYVAGKEQIAALDDITGAEIWRVPFSERLQHPAGVGPTTLAVSPDGRWLYVISRDAGDPSAPPGIERIDTTTGRLMPSSARLFDCASPRLAIPSAGSTFITCPDDIRLHNPESTMHLSGSIVGAEFQTPGAAADQPAHYDAVLSKDRQWVYVLTANYEIVPHAAAEGHRGPPIPLTPPEWPIAGASLALSGDGRTLVVASIPAEQPGAPSVTTLHIIDLASWSQRDILRLERPLRPHALAVSVDGRTVYAAAVRGGTGEAADTILTIDTASGEVLAEHARPGENILRLSLYSATPLASEALAHLPAPISAPPTPTLPGATATPSGPPPPPPDWVDPTTGQVDAEMMPDCIPIAEQSPLRETYGDCMSREESLAQPPPPTPEPGPMAELTSGILHIRYEEFLFEGDLPPGIGPARADFTEEQWIDLSDPGRSRLERRYRTRMKPPQAGLAEYAVGTGAGGILSSCTVSQDDGAAECEERPQPAQISVDSWWRHYTMLGQTALAQVDLPAITLFDGSAVLDGFRYRGIERHDRWGEVYVFERTVTLDKSRLYLGLPMTETLMFDTELLRLVERRRTVRHERQGVLLQSRRLTTWEILDPAKVPETIFSP